MERNASVTVVLPTTTNNRKVANKQNPTGHKQAAHGYKQILQTIYIRIDDTAVFSR